MTRFEQMETAVAPDHLEVIVQTVRLVPGEGVVVYASMPEDSATAAVGAERRTENRRRLVTILWEHLQAGESSLWKHPHFSSRVAFPIQLAHDTLGRPQFQLGEHPGPAISFSTAGEEVWAALCGDGSDIGIDVAGSTEFPEGYPRHRVFHEQELQPALALAGGNPARAAALLWSIKEAVAKALGCAFHLVDPRDIHVQPSAAAAHLDTAPTPSPRLSGEREKNGGSARMRSAAADDGPAFSVRLSGKALVRFPLADRRPITVRSLPQAGTWLSIAALNWPRHRVAGLNGWETDPRD